MKLYALAWIGCSSVAFAAGGDKQPPNPAEYTIPVHVLSSYARVAFQGNNLTFSYSQEVHAVIDGKPVQLTGYTGYVTVLALGDYKAKILPSRIAAKRITSPADVDITYEILFPNGNTRVYQLTGFDPVKQ